MPVDIEKLIDCANEAVTVVEGIGVVENGKKLTLLKPSPAESRRLAEVCRKLGRILGREITPVTPERRESDSGG